MAKKTQSLCPDCYLVDGIDTPIDIRPGQELRCPIGHSWGIGDSDSSGGMTAMERYDQRQAMARHKREQIRKQENPEPESNEPKVSAIVKSNTGDEIIIDKESRQRISALVGDFPDGATLYGAIFSLAQDMRDLQDQMKALQQSKVISAALPADSGMAKNADGDIAVMVMIPERHVVPLNDIAEAQGCDVPLYVNSIISSGLDNGWFY